MGAVWKVMAGLLLTLPVTAYITGTLVTAETDMPAERAPVVIPDTPRVPQSPRPTTAPLGPDDDGRREGDSDDDEVKVVRPTPDDLDDDEGREENRGDDGDGTDDGQEGDDDD